MNDINFTQDYFLYTPKKQGIFPIQENDWNRLKALIKKIIPQKKVYSIISSISFGVFISAIFSLISLSTIEHVPSWLVPTNWIVAVFSLILGIALIIIDNQQKEIIQFTSDFIIEEFEKLEKQFVRENEEGSKQTI